MKKSDSKHSFGKTLKRGLEKHGLSLREAARIAGVSPSQIHSWVNGAHPHNMHAVLSLCRKLRIDFQYLLTGHHSAHESSESRSSKFEE